MKKIILIYTAWIAILCQGFITLSAQHITETGNQWNIAVYPTFSPNTKSYIVYIGEDTLLDGTWYKKVYHSNDSTASQKFFSNLYMREDSTGKVFHRGWFDEILLYDFGLEVNDTFFIDDYCQWIVREIDTIYLNNGEPRKRLALQSDMYDLGYYFHWIEGIGSEELGVLSHLHSCGTDYADGLLCFYNNQELLYPEDPPSCFIVSTQTVEDDAGIQVYPNPCTDRLFIADNRSLFTRYILHDLTGRVVQSGYLTNTVTQIDLADVHTGCYLLMLQDLNGHSHAQLIIKH